MAEVPSKNRTLISTSEAIIGLLYRLYANGTRLRQMRKRYDEIRRLFDTGVTKLETGRRFSRASRVNC